MKYDMAGGATMLGVMRALATLKPNVKVICVVPATENMPGGHSAKTRRYSDGHVWQNH